MLTFSRYSILSDPLPGGGYVLLNGISGALDFLSNELGGLLSVALWEGDDEAIANLVPLLPGEVRTSFEARGHLTPLPAEAEKDIVVGIAQAMHDAVSAKPTFMIVPNLDCNYRC